MFYVFTKQLPAHDYITKLCRQRSFKIMIMRMFATLDKAKPDIENMRLKLGGSHMYDRSGV
jgi:hypothetical protein